MERLQNPPESLDFDSVLVYDDSVSLKGKGE